MMNIQQKRDLLMSLPLMEQEQRWIMERLDTLSVKEQYQLSAAILRTGKLEELAGKTGWELETAILHMDPEVAVDAVNCLLSLEDYQICFPRELRAAGELLSTARKPSAGTRHVLCGPGGAGPPL